MYTLRSPSRLATQCVTTLLLCLLVSCGGKQPAQTSQVSGKYAFWPQPPDEPRIQFLVAFNQASDIAPSRSNFDKMLYGKGDEDLPIAKPYGVAMWDGKIYICDIRGQGITILDLRKQETRVMGAQGNGQLQHPVDIAVAEDGTKYVADLHRGAVFVYDAADRFVTQITASNFNPVGLAVHGKELYVCDFKGQHVKVLDRVSGQIVRTFGEPGAEDGQFVRPLSVTVDKDGNVLVADVMKCRIQKFTPDGKLISAFGQMGNRPGDFVRPKHLRAASDGVLYVVDAAFNNVQLFDEDGKVMMFFGSAGYHPGAMDLPAGLAVREGDLDLFQKYVHPAFQAERLILVTNQFGTQKVSVYAMGRLKEGKTVADVSTGRITVADSTQGTGTPVDTGAPPVDQPDTQPAVEKPAQ